MAKTANLGLPLIAPSQAQKHVTVNDALSRLDAVTQLRVLDTAGAAPPAEADDGACYIVGGGAIGDWAGKSGQIAFRSNGGWLFLEPAPGWRAWNASAATSVVFDGTEWIPGAVAMSAHGACTIAEISEFEYVITSGATHTIAGAIPANSQVLGVSGRVLESISGTGVSGWRIGVPGAEGRFGTGLGTGAGSYLLGLSGTPTAYYADTPLIIAAEGGVFASGRVRIAVHVMRLRPPR